MSAIGRTSVPLLEPALRRHLPRQRRRAQTPNDAIQFRRRRASGTSRAAAAAAAAGNRIRYRRPQLPADGGGRTRRRRLPLVALAEPEVGAVRPPLEAFDDLVQLAFVDLAESVAAHLRRTVEFGEQLGHLFGTRDDAGVVRTHRVTCALENRVQALVKIDEKNTRLYLLSTSDMIQSVDVVSSCVDLYLLRTLVL